MLDLKEERTITATVITDASFSHVTPGRKTRNKRGKGYGGWAAWVQVDGRLDAVRGYGTIKDPELQNSAEAEIYAALNGIWIAAQYGAKEILVRSDCMTVMHFIQGRGNSPRIRKIWDNALARPDLRGLELRGVHVKGHGQIKDAATYANDWADRHAQRAMKQARNGFTCQVIN